VNLEEYFEQLANWEELPAAELVAAWERGDIEGVTEDFRAAYDRTGFGARVLEVPAETSNQSIGNRVAEFFVGAIGPQLEAHRIDACRGPGYPDKRLVRLDAQRTFAFELKATSHFNRNDSNRIVLTCSSRKLREQFEAPINHLLGTVSYVKDGNQITVEHLRLDFLEPDSPVDVRLEGSVSQKGLSRGAQESVTF
jgi:hypothetical protein